jgi:hypothetical protein
MSQISSVARMSAVIPGVQEGSAKAFPHVASLMRATDLRRNPFATTSSAHSRDLDETIRLRLCQSDGH